jgi:hypothetical protein
MTSKIYRHTFLFFSLLFLFIQGCRGSIPEIIRPSMEKGKASLQSLGYTIQAGAFSDVNNAVRLTSYLQEKGFDAYYFLHESGLYKVRFGNYSTLESARNAAEEIRINGIIAEYMIIRPEDYPRLAGKKMDYSGLRNDLVASARGFLGVPYYWGGVSSSTGFDCSGLTMSVYKLNGLNLPRTTKQQWASGHPVELKKLSKGDLVFFSTKKAREISHVGMYIGDNEFIHSPGDGKKIRVESMRNDYFQSRYMGARTYLE